MIDRPSVLSTWSCPLCCQLLHYSLGQVCLVLGARFFTSVAFTQVIEPSSTFPGWGAAVAPVDHPVGGMLFDVIIGAYGTGSLFPGFQSKVPSLAGVVAPVITRRLPCATPGMPMSGNIPSDIPRQPGDRRDGKLCQLADPGGGGAGRDSRSRPPLPPGILFELEPAADGLPMGLPRGVCAAAWHAALVWLGRMSFFFFFVTAAEAIGVGGACRHPGW